MLTEKKGRGKILRSVRTASSSRDRRSANLALPQRVILQFPEPLLIRTDYIADQLKINRSNLIRCAVEEKLERIEKERLALELQAGYQEMSRVRSSDHDELNHLTTELLGREA